MMTEGKVEWTWAEKWEGKARMMGNTSWSLESAQRRIHANGHNFCIGWIYAQFLEMRIFSSFCNDTLPSGKEKNKETPNRKH